MSENTQDTFNAGQKINFPEIVKIDPCTYNECTNGHKWPMQLAIAQCPGCQAPILGVRMVNCPVCNEPVSKVKVRTDHMAGGMGIAAVCRGQKGLAEVNFVEMIRNAHVECMNKWNEESGRMVIE